MLRRCPNHGQKAQIFLEYVIVVSVVILITLAMSMMIKRGTQGMVKVVADQIGMQINSEQQFNEGYLKSSYVTTRTFVDKRKSEFIGDTVYIYDDVVTSNTTSFINLGFREE